MSGPVELYFIFLASGLVLLAVEIFSPGGVVGAFGAAAIAGAMVTGFFAFGLQGGFFSAMAILIFGSIFLIAWMKLFPKTGLGTKLSHTTDGRDFKSSPADWQALAGKEGVAQSDLRPGGLALIDGQRVDVVSEAGYITKGARIQVSAVEGYRIIVRQLASS